MSAWTDKERWLPIPGHEGRYDISDRGRLRSWVGNRGVLRAAPVLVTGSISVPDGYRVYTLAGEGRARVRRGAHQLVLLAFVGPKPAGLVTRHLDGNPLNNTLGNICYGTQAENCADILRHGRHPFANRTHCIHGHEFTPENTVRQVQPNGRPSRRCRECRRLSCGPRIARRSAERAAKRAAKELAA